ncbi:wax ester synthase/diacylglycerol acyltransferase 11-like isoform X1 [Triticum urartu]|uniref:wax ester synthase/diacylglycerol acyltransferase 11-like isoform X1 n=1 Tax=Triticum urartu TaxID=4572 RepID=UPI002043A438|nr:wax ester synthase/diacylglycerol acyltransferase 11-like isoform X1 [Triticum urartu]
MEATMNVATPPSRSLSVHVSAETESADNSTAEDPMSPTGRVFEEMGVYIIVVMGLSMPVNLPVFCAGIETELLTRFPRFRSIQVMDGSKDGKPRWVQTVVNVDDHIIVPRLDLAAVDSDPEKAVEDYVASLSLLPMDRRRPLWEFHFLDFRTSEAASTTVLRLHHSIGDGMSIMTLLMASSRSTADPARLPAMPPPPKRTGAIYQRCPQPPRLWSSDYLAWLWSYVVLAWHTLVDIVLLAATVLFLRDPGTMFTLVPDGGQSRRRKRLVHQSLRLDDVKLIKTVLNCTMNDVLVGVTSAALSRYYFRKSCNINTKRICLRSILPVNTRPVSSRQTYVTKVETGNRISNIICPFYIALHNDPLEYVRTAKRSMHRKKSSLEVMFAQMTVDFLVKYFGPKTGAFIFRCFVTRTTAVLSNVVGPAEHITLCGHPIAFMAISVYGLPQALTMHYLNYGSNIKVILTVDDEQFPDCHQLLNDFAESVKLVRDAASLKTLTTSIQND